MSPDDQIMEISTPVFDGRIHAVYQTKNLTTLDSSPRDQARGKTAPRPVKKDLAPPAEEDPEETASGVDLFV